MRDANGSVKRYVPNVFPTGGDKEMQDLKQFLRVEFSNIRTTLDQVCDGYLDVTHVAPDKPRNGMLRRADGTNWDPGSGAGVYCYYASAWHFLG